VKKGEVMPVRKRAQLMRDHGKTYRQIAKRFGVSETTVRRWLNPKYAALQAELSSRARSRRTGTCERCGKTTHYSGRGPTKVGRWCHPCHNILWSTPERIAAQTVWTRERIIEAIQSYAATHGGEPPRSTELGGGDLPALTTLLKRFRTWNEAVAAAGLTPRPPTSQLLKGTGKHQEGEDP